MPGPPRTYGKTIVVRITDDAHDRLTKAAKATGRNLTQMVRAALDDWLDEHTK